MPIHRTHPWLASVFPIVGLALLLNCSGGGGNPGAGPGGGPQGVAPTISTNPDSATVPAGQTVSFTVQATGTPSPSLQWERSPDGNAWSPVPGAGGSSLAFPAAKEDNGSRYRAKASNASGSATSSPASLTVHWAPAILTQPLNRTVNSPASASFQVTLDCNPQAACQWQSSPDGSAWGDILGATDPAFTTGPTTPQMNGWSFRCVCTNPLGSTTSRAAVLTVDAPSYNLTVQLDSGATGTPGGGGTFPAGAAVDYAYAAKPGFTDLRVQLDGETVSPAGSFSMNGPRRLEVSTQPIPRSVTFSAGSGGSLSGNLSQTVPHGGSTSPVTAVPGAGFAFVNWTGSGFTPSTANPLVVTNVQGNLALTANFQPLAASYTITASAGIWGSISPSGAVSVAAGGSQTFTITADPYYTISDVVVDGVSVGQVSTYTFTNVTSNHTIRATFY
ncbi:MAG: immunoglobulin domain-containing protein [Acidobacteria bacterium]|nr:immunoglobulin domain-containing protein [Acidobacteriota bacterium]